MDINSYSYTAPGFGVDRPVKYDTFDKVEIEKRVFPRGTLYVVRAGDGSNTFHDLKSALKFASEMIGGCLK